MRVCSSTYIIYYSFMYICHYQNECFHSLSASKGRWITIDSLLNSMDKASYSLEHWLLPTWKQWENPCETILHSLWYSGTQVLSTDHPEPLRSTDVCYDALFLQWYRNFFFLEIYKGAYHRGIKFSRVIQNLKTAKLHCTFTNNVIVSIAVNPVIWD